MAGVSVDRSRANECGTKKAHPTRQAARGHVWSLKSAGAAAWRLKVYRCKHCSSWHVGHNPKPKRNRA
jgi:hypothetical protein